VPFFVRPSRRDGFDAHDPFFDATRQHRLEQFPSCQAVAEYLSVLNDAAFGGETQKIALTETAMAVLVKVE
jgi:hypothetical protein